MSLGDSRGDERAGKRLRFNDSVDYLRSGEGRVEDRAHDRSQSVPLSFPLADGNQYTSGGFNRASYVSEFEQEMIAALGLSPTESRQPRSLQATTFEPRLALSLTNGFGQGLALHQQRSDPRAKVGTRECDRNDYVTGASNFNNLGPWESLPHLFGESAQQPKPFEHPGHPDASVLSHMVESQPQSAVDSTMPTIPTIRPVHDEDAGNKPLILAKNSPLPHILPPMTFSLDDSSEDDVPPTPPPKDMPRRKPVATHLVPPSNYTARKPSVSTLGADEEIPDRLSEELRNPPSPDLLPKTATEDQSDDPIYGKSLPSAKYSGHSPQVAEENLDLREFAPAFPKSPGSDEILESKRRSIGGVAPSIPGVQSPLRNEVRFSPAARGTLLSSNSFGRQNTNNSKGAREVPYRMESASPSQNSNSKINKLKNFGKRQRTSMGNVLSGFQGGSQKEHQGPQASIQKKNNVSSDQGSDKKNRALGKLGVSLP
ncbi:hypothetical protein N7462_001677 [Penicillium macrosclerotiorum]|uniref:uncharacterized protein n=1 Tax=Penicillium macrosclerotiorum TaxID=303699 RepID=UPI0025475365|nr:uncharacterized protein N7462_001677 [Penicillium macrosclerotiorum]KAJ5692254.1 hypothetical protein N7462_001677 [Penicillium macrosclerotiorum]